MADTDIWMPFYVADYLADTMHLNPAEHGGYLMLILHYWKSGPIPDDDVRLSTISRLGDAWSNASSTLRAFFEYENGMLVHRRIDREKANAIVNKDKNQARAKAAAEKRWGKNAPSNAPSMPQALLDECPSPSPSPISLKSKTNTSASPPGDYPPEFEEAWAAYPPRPGASKKDACKAWAARRKEGVSAADLLAGVQRYANYVLYSRTEPQFTKQPATFFGPGEHYKADWAVTGGAPQKGTAHGNFCKQDYSKGVGPDGQF